ncbi:CDP-glycerol glycerophosphotransferase family protein [Heyndrickxia oleronia]|nr:CDP-glycerol glycerophosphotransferase family protein [Heyndrickxia oleronia]
MVREVLIWLYLIFFKFQFNLFKWLPLKQKITFIVSFSQNSLFIYEELKRRKVPLKIVFLCEPSCYEDVKERIDGDALLLKNQNVFKMAKGIYHLATSKFIIIDNYFAFLSTVKFKDEAQCIQLWHAAGAIKTFGFRDHSIKSRTNSANRRFTKVYQQFHKIVVGSDLMASIFMEAFKLTEDHIIRTGIPRTDFFYQINEQEKRKKEWMHSHPFLKNKKVILYAPTFRDGNVKHFEKILDINYLYHSLGEEYVILIKLHPTVQEKLDFDYDLYKGFIYDFSYYKDVNDILLITDYLITDYSSIPYEFSLLGKPMIFYPFDLEQYEIERGLWGKYEDLVPGPVVFNTEQMVYVIKENKFDLNRVKEFSNIWNKYSEGYSSKNLVDYLCRKLG